MTQKGNEIMKRINQPKQQRETVRIQFWNQDGPMVAIDHVEQYVPWGSGKYAAAACLMGLQKFLVPNMPDRQFALDDESMKLIGDTLAVWNQLMDQAKEMKKSNQSEVVPDQDNGTDKLADEDSHNDSEKTSEKTSEKENAKLRSISGDKSKSKPKSKSRK
jgi:hypothetical protein